jgi:hypothetical protein
LSCFTICWLHGFTVTAPWKKIKIYSDFVLLLLSQTKRVKSSGQDWAAPPSTQGHLERFAVKLSQSPLSPAHIFWPDPLDVVTYMYMEFLWITGIAPQCFRYMLLHTANHEIFASVLFSRMQSNANLRHVKISTPMH